MPPVFLLRPVLMLLVRWNPGSNTVSSNACQELRNRGQMAKINKKRRFHKREMNNTRKKKRKKTIDYCVLPREMTQRQVIVRRGTQRRFQPTIRTVPAGRKLAAMTTTTTTTSRAQRSTTSREYAARPSSATRTSGFTIQSTISNPGF